MSELHAKLDRIDRKLDAIQCLLDALVEALATEERGDDVPMLTLDGQHSGAERDSSQPL